MNDWVKELLEKYPNCSNPINYPQSALFYLQIMKWWKSL